MVTFTDSPAGLFPTFEAFLAARRIVRSAAAEQLAGLHQERADALTSLERHFAQVAADTRDNEAGLLSHAAIMVELKMRAVQERSAVKARYDGKIEEIYGRYGLKRSARAQSATDVRDYHHAADMHRQDATTDPQAQVDLVLQNLPGVRRRRENGWLVYESAVLHGALGKRELLRCDDANVVVRGADDDRIRTGLHLAAQRYAPPIRIAGTPEFVRRSQAIAESLGLAFESAQEASAAPASEPQATHAEGTPAAATPEQQKAAESATVGKYAVMPSDERLEALKSELGVSLAAALSKLNKHLQDGKAVRRISNFWPDADGVVLIMGNAAMVVPVDPSLTVELDSTVRISEGEGGRFILETIGQEQTASVDPDKGQERDDDVVVHSRGQSR